jgi:hypothetical protein
MQEFFTKKLYYKKYNHRILFKCQKSGVKDTLAPSGEIITWLLDQKFAGQWRGITSYAYDTKQTSYTIFFKNPDIYEHLAGLVDAKYFVEYEKPLDDQHTQMLETEKVVTRKTLFHGKYRIACRVDAKYKSRYNYSQQHIREMEAWCKEQFGSPYSNRDRYRVNSWQNATFFFAEPRDATLFKLTHSDIRLTERVVLISEMEAQRASETAEQTS